MYRLYKPKNKISLVIIAVIALIFVYILYQIFSSSSADQTNYMTVPAKRGDIEVTALATGIAKPYHLVAVGARATGRIISLKVQPGSVVKEGDLLAEIDSTTQKNDLKNKEAALTNNEAKLAEQQAQLILAEKNLARQQTMIATNAVSKADFDSAEAEVSVRRAQIDALKAQIVQSQVDVETAKVDLSYTQVTAPFDGTVLATVVQEGQNVNAVQSAPTIAIIGNLSKMTIRAEISEADVVNIKVGQPLYFNVIGNPNRRYDSVLQSIEPAPESIRNDISFTSSTTSSSSSNSSAIYYNGIFNVDNSDGSLRTYMTAEVKIVLGKAENVLLIASDGLSAQQADGSYSVRILNSKDQVEIRNVKIGLNDKVNAQVLSGLNEGDKVITGSGTLNNKSTSTSNRRMGPW